MKLKLLLLPMLVMAVLCTAFNSCKDKGKIVNGMVPSVAIRQLNISSHSLSMGPSSQNQSIQIKSPGTAWEFTDIPSWITVVPSKGSGQETNVRVSVRENSSTTNRVGVVTLRSLEGDWNYSTQLTVTQQRAQYSARPQVSRLDFDGKAGSTSVAIVSNINTWTASVPTSAASWCTATKNGNDLTVTVKANTMNVSRSVNVEVTTVESCEYLTVTQRPANISSTTQSLSFAVGGGTESIQIQAEAAWMAGTSYSWIDITPQTGQAGTSAVSIRTLANNTTNDRKGYVYLELSENNRIEIPVQQEGIHLSVDKTDLEFPVTASSAKLNVLSNAPWKFADCIPEWITVTPSSGTGNAAVTVKVTGHNSAESRQTKLSVSPTAVDSPCEIDIFQAGHTLEADSTSLHFSARAGRLTFNLESDADWVTASANDWINVTPSSGSGRQTISVTVTANESDKARNGTVTIGIDDKTVTVPVYQAGRYITVTSKALDFTSKGGSTQVSLSSDTDWKIESGADWLTTSVSSGSDNASVIITASDNPSSTPRSGKVTVTSQGLTPVSISVSQAARYLRTSVDTLEFFREGGTSDAVLIETDGVCEITNPAPWITVNRLSATQFTLTATEYTEGPDDRKATLTLSLTDVTSGTVSKSIAVTQRHKIQPQYVDLGLSVLWSTFNVGAESPEESGDYFAWGETSPKTEFTWLNLKYSNGSSSTMTKYCTSSSYGKVDNKTVLDLTDDAARTNWGGSWRMPTKSEYDELSNSDNCTWTWYDSGNSEFGGVAGYKVISKKSGYEGNWIFFPVAGFRLGSNLSAVSYGGYYWSGSLNTDSPDNAWHLCFDIDIRPCAYNFSRYYGLSVRPVRPFAVTGITLSNQSLEMFETATATLTATLSPSKASGYTITWSSSNTNVATVEQSGKITAVTTGTCTVTATCEGRSATCSVTVKPWAPPYVDLGLSVMWATFNVGAETPEEYGDYFAWGETEPYYQSGYAQSSNPLWKSGKSAGYDWSTYKYCNGSFTTMTKYCTSSSCGTVDNKTVLDLTDDAARANWGGSWRMPTQTEFEELLSTDNCTWTWYYSGNTEFNGVAGYKVTSRKSGYSGNWIFLPAVGWRSGTYIVGVGSGVGLWSSSLCTDRPGFALTLCFDRRDRTKDPTDRFQGQAVRPVRPFPLTGIALSTQSLEMFATATATLTATLSPSKDFGHTVTWSSSNKNVATVDQTGKITAVTAGTCTVTATCEGHYASCSVIVNPFVPQYVDLGLSVKWATCNVGSTSPTEYGDYFAWGETSPKTDYSWNTYRYCNVSRWSYSMTKYYSTVDNKTVLDLNDDAARVYWGGSWRMPTNTEYDELLNTDNCTWIWYDSGNSEFDGVAGYKVISKKSGYSGNWIFLPAAGWRYDTSLLDAGSYGHYWSSSLCTDAPDFAWGFYFNSGDHYTDIYDRYNGQSVRPVQPIAVTGITLSSQSLEMFETAIATLTATVSPSRAANYPISWSSSNTGVASVDQSGKITAVTIGTCTVTATCEGHTATCSITVKPFVPQYVDLGLSVKWATCNVGATSPEGYGDYFAWGATEPWYQPGYAQSSSPEWKNGKSAGYDWSTYKYCNGSLTTMTKYCTSSSYGTVDNKTVLDLTDDAARANWGGSWRMPTEAEFSELSNSSNCTWTWYSSGNTEFNGVAGYKVTSRKSGYVGNYIFLPATGYRNGTSLSSAGSCGYYWSSSLSTNYPYGARDLYFDSGYRYTSSNDRYCGRSVRPVCR